MSPHLLLFPLPRLAGAGERGDGRAQTHGCRRGLNYVARHGGLTYAMKFSYGTLRFLHLC